MKKDREIFELLPPLLVPSADQGFGAEDFLPALSYVIVQCNMPELHVEVEYMMELLEPTWLTGEGKRC